MWDEKYNYFILLKSSSHSSSCFSASHRTLPLAHMFICTRPIPPFVMSCFIAASITQFSPSLGIAYRLITFQEFNVMTGGQANFWSDKWWAKWLQSTMRQMVLDLLCKMAQAFSLMAFSDNVKQKERQRLSLSIYPRNKEMKSAWIKLLLLFF